MNSTTQFDMDSCKLFELYNAIETSEAVPASEFDLMGLRIMIVRLKDSKEIFITQDQIVLSIATGRSYRINRKVLSEALEEISENAEKHERKLPNKAL